jgi:hypothetical protein
MYEVTPAEWMRRKAEDTQLYQIVRIDGDRLHFESRTARGVVYDAFTLRKRRGAANQMTNLVPATQENRRVTGETSAGKGG